MQETGLVVDPPPTFERWQQVASHIELRCARGRAAKPAKPRNQGGGQRPWVLRPAALLPRALRSEPATRPALVARRRPQISPTTTHTRGRRPNTWRSYHPLIARREDQLAGIGAALDTFDKAFARLMVRRRAVQAALAEAMARIHASSEARTAAVAPGAEAGADEAQEAMAELSDNLFREYRLRLLVQCSLTLLLDEQQHATMMLHSWWARRARLRGLQAQPAPARVEQWRARRCCAVGLAGRALPLPFNLRPPRTHGYIHQF